MDHAMHPAIAVVAERESCWGPIENAEARAKVIVRDLILFGLMPGFVARDGTPLAPKQPPQIESDDAYRERLKEVVGEASVHTAKLKTAAGEALDEIGAIYETLRGKK